MDAVKFYTISNSGVGLIAIMDAFSRLKVEDDPHKAHWLWVL